MEAAVKAEVEALMESTDQGVNSRLDRIIDVLKRNNLAWVATLKPSELLTHPENRGSTMCNPYDVHFKGEKILSTGLKPSLLPSSSVAIELSQVPATRNWQLQKNKDLVANSQGMLAAVSGQERYLTLGCSHFVQYCRALQSQALSPNGESLHMPLDLESVVQDGWQWCVVSCKVEECLSSFARFCQLTLNSCNTTALASTELQTMLQIAKLLENGVPLQSALKSVKAGEPACGHYLQDVAHYVRMFGGGKSMPLLQHLQAFSSQAS